MNWLDVVLAILILGSIITSFGKGFSRELVGFVSVLAAILLGAWFYGLAGAWLQPYVSSRGIANFCGFVLVFCGVVVLGSVLGHSLSRMVKVAGLSWFDHMLGAVFGAVRGLLIAIALVMAMMAFAPQGKPPQSVVRSRGAPYVIDAARVFAAMAPYELKDGFRKSYEQVKGVWGNVLKKGIDRRGEREGTI